jgi:hypothetical protein
VSGILPSPGACAPTPLPTALTRNQPRGGVAERNAETTIRRTYPDASPPGDRARVGMNGLMVTFAVSISLEHRDVNEALVSGAIAAIAGAILIRT